MQIFWLFSVVFTNNCTQMRTSEKTSKNTSPAPTSPLNQSKYTSQGSSCMKQFLAWHKVFQKVSLSICNNFKDCSCTKHVLDTNVHCILPHSLLLKIAMKLTTCRGVHVRIPVKVTKTKQECSSLPHTKILSCICIPFAYKKTTLHLLLDKLTNPICNGCRVVYFCVNNPHCFTTFFRSSVGNCLLVQVTAQDPIQNEMLMNHTNWSGNHFLVW